MNARSISVARTEDYLALRTNGKVNASNHDRGTQLSVGHLGAVFHPAPRALPKKTLLDKNLELLAQYRAGRLPRDVEIPDHTAALLAVAETLLNQDENEAADRVLRKGRRVFPEDANLKRVAPAD